jgi:hypothetical protein
MARPLNAGRRRRRLALGALVLGVLALHLGALRLVGDTLARLAFEAERPKRLQAMFVRELLPAPAPRIAAATPLPRGPRPVKPLPSPEAAASQPAPPQDAPPEAQPPLPEVAEAFAPMPEAATSAPPNAEAAASAPTSPAFEWPASTQLSYALKGNYRGPVEGSAQVEWVREGDRYQVHLDAIVGLAIAPLFTRRMTSDGTLGPEGLAPQRYDEETRRAFGEPRRVVLRFGRDTVWLANGERRDALPGLQDSASQFVQLTWLFRTHPQLLAVGNTIEVPLALPRSVDRWVYDVVGSETLYASFGAVETFHLKPRRVAQAGGDMTAEMWFAPALDYLPVRIRIAQDAEAYVDMTIERAPLQAIDPPARPDADPYSPGSIEPQRRPPR